MNFPIDVLALLGMVFVCSIPCFALYRRMMQGRGDERSSIVLLFVSWLMLYSAPMIYGFIHYWRIGEL